MTGTPADEQAIRDIVERVEAGWNAKDVAGLVAMVTEDYQGLSADGKMTNGRAGYEANLKTEFEMARPEGFALSLETGYVDWHGATTAAVGGTFAVAGLPAGMPNTGSWLCVFSRAGDQWLISNALVADFVPPPATGGGGQ
jgi:uncharacterized protein (TIGR02246 family)